VQEGLLAALRNLHRFEGVACISRWLTRIVINAALMRRRALPRGLTESKWERYMGMPKGVGDARTVYNEGSSVRLRRLKAVDSGMNSPRLAFQHASNGTNSEAVDFGRGTARSHFRHFSAVKLFFLWAAWLNLYELPAESPFDTKMAATHAMVER
jgi:hypothetical protein